MTVRPVLPLSSATSLQERRGRNSKPGGTHTDISSWFHNHQYSSSMPYPLQSVERSLLLSGAVLQFLGPSSTHCRGSEFKVEYVFMWDESDIPLHCSCSHLVRRVYPLGKLRRSWERWQAVWYQVGMETVIEWREEPVTLLVALTLLPPAEIDPPVGTFTTRRLVSPIHSPWENVRTYAFAKVALI